MKNNVELFNSEDGLDYYYRSLSKKYKPLTREQERELIIQAKNGSVKSRNLLVEKNLRLVFKLAKKYGGKGVPIMELISEGNNALFKAIDNFDLEKENKFMTYALFWVRDALSRKLREQKSIETMETSAYDENVADDEDSDFHISYLATANNPNEEDPSVFAREAMGVLDEVELKVISMSFGFIDKQLQLADIANALNLSVERVRQIRLKAIRKMRQYAVQEGIMTVSQALEAKVGRY